MKILQFLWMVVCIVVALFLGYIVLKVFIEQITGIAKFVALVVMNSKSIFKTLGVVFLSVVVVGSIFKLLAMLFEPLTYKRSVKHGKRKTKA